MKREILYLVTSEYEGFTIEQFLKKKHYTYQALVNLKKTSESVLLNGEWAYLRTQLHDKDLLTIRVIDAECSQTILPLHTALDIVYEDEDIIVINKPSGMPIHPSMNHNENTLANALVGYYEEKKEEFVFRCINRLDRETSGLTIVAKHYLSAGILNSDMEKRKIKRNYMAFCCEMNTIEGIGMYSLQDKMSHIERVVLAESGCINLPIYREEGSLIKRCVDAKGERAVTHYQYFGRINGIALMELWLETGRTHQIRVHLASLGHPLLGDELYGGDCNRIQRVALHARRLEFMHPILRTPMTFEVDYPDDMWQLLQESTLCS